LLLLQPPMTTAAIAAATAAAVAAAAAAAVTAAEAATCLYHWRIHTGMTARGGCNRKKKRGHDRVVTWVNHCSALTCQRGTAPALVQRVAPSAV
jgi:hypothetical protein